MRELTFVERPARRLIRFGYEVDGCPGQQLLLCVCCSDWWSALSCSRFSTSAMPRETFRPITMPAPWSFRSWKPIMVSTATSHGVRSAMLQSGLSMCVKSILRPKSCYKPPMWDVCSATFVFFIIRPWLWHLLEWP